jgi:hypothetical protein
VTSGAQTAAAASPADATTDALFGQLVLAVAELFGYTPVAGDALPTLATFGTFLDTAVAGIVTNPTAALLPVQATYYMGMLGSTPARMFMSSGGSSSSGAGAGALDGMRDSLLANVSKLVDGKAETVLTGVGGQLSKWGAGIQAGIQAQMANAMHAGGLSVPHGWHTGVPDVSRAAPLLPTNSVASPSMTTGLPTSPFSQGLMGALAGRGMSAMGSKVAAKVMPRSPAGG